MKLSSLDLAKASLHTSLTKAETPGFNLKVAVKLNFPQLNSFDGEAALPPRYNSISLLNRPLLIFSLFIL